MRALCLLPIVLLGVAGAASAENKFFPMKDPMTDAAGGIAALNADGDLQVGIVCDARTGGQMSVGLVSRQPVIDAQRPVKIRIDGGTPFEMPANYSGHGILIENGAKPDSPGGKLISRLLTAKHIVLQILDSGDVPITDEFDLGDAADKINQVFAACPDTAWSLKAKPSH